MLDRCQIRVRYESDRSQIRVLTDTKRIAYCRVQLEDLGLGLGLGLGLAYCRVELEDLVQGSFVFKVNINVTVLGVGRDVMYEMLHPPVG